MRARLFFVAVGLIACGDETVEPGAAVDDVRTAKIESAVFECKTTEKLGDGKHHSLKFSLGGLNGNTESLKWIGDSAKAEEDDDDESWAVTTVPEDSPLMALNLDGSVKLENGELELYGDNIGAEFVTVVLYSNSGFRSGFARVKDGWGGNGNHYSKLACEVTNVGAQASNRPTNERKTRCGGLVGARCPANTRCVKPRGSDTMGVCK